VVRPRGRDDSIVGGRKRLAEPRAAEDTPWPRSRDTWEDLTAVDVEACFRAMTSRDPRFDGRFVVAVPTTRVYCRPSCPAALPKPRNVRFYAHPAAAEEEGFRPCRRCRPELSPDLRTWPDTSRTVARAMRLITEGALDGDGGVASLADRLGVGDRHLRRLFAKHLGASPIAILQTQRIHFARRLLDETTLPITDLALRAGFSSIRRFNDVFRRTFAVAPSRVRSARSESDTGELRLRLPFAAPYDWAAMLAFLGPRAIPGVESVDDDRYRRSIEVGGVRTAIEVRHRPGDRQLELRILAPLPPDLLRVVGRTRLTFDVDSDPVRIARHLSRDRRLSSLVQRAPGLRLPGAWDPFELAVRAILGQQVSVRAASTLAGRLAARFGTAVKTPFADLTHCFPSPASLGDADLSGIGIPTARAETIRRVAGAVATGLLVLDGSRASGETVAALRRLRGIGDWTAQYIAMRALGEPDAFLKDDLGVRKALTKNGEPPSPGTIVRLAEAWRPYRAYGVLHLWRSLA
jgi:AraC family transcriptional regulator of adaptative response / DNA-3-methyladenine glycosylase II